MNAIDRTRFQNERALRRLHDSAIRQARLEGGGVGSGTAAITTFAQSESSADADGNTLEGEMFWGDNWGSYWSA